MARPIRISMAGGWYHITARGHNRSRIFKDDRDHLHFLELLEEMVEQYRVEVHAYVLMPNHYHLLIRTPEANVSRALQWLNQSYGTWKNLRYGGSGQVFQGRFKSILVEGGAWNLSLSLYLHFNPVAVKGLGWGKGMKKAEALGLKKPTPEVVMARLETLRGHAWSSYRAYAGYEKGPAWLTMDEVLKRVKGGRAGYRRLAEERLKQGQSEGVWTQLKWGVVLGSERFAESIKKQLKIGRETGGHRVLRQGSSWKEVVQAVETVKGEKWGDFRDRHGDWGRDVVLWVARRQTGLTLREMGVLAGGMDYAAVAMGIRQTKLRMKHEKNLQKIAGQINEILHFKM